MSDLALIQQLFWQAVTTQTPVSEAALQGIVVRSATLSPAQRVQIYANMYADRLVEALAADFPNLAKALGPNAFRGMALGYVARHPSEQPSISYVGHHLPAYLRSCGGLPRPDLADLAALEWARSAVFEAAPGRSIAATALADLAEDALPQARFGFVPAMQRVEAQFETAALWRALEDSDEERPPLPEPTAGRTTLVVWRAEYEVLHTVLGAEAAEGLRRAQAEEPLAAVCEAFSALDNPVQAAFGAIGAWFADGWVARLWV